MYDHQCYKLRNSLGGYGGIRVVRVSDDLGGSSSLRGGGIVAKSAVVHSRWCVKNQSEFRWILMALVWPSLHASVGQSDAFEDFQCLNSYPLDQVSSGKFFRGNINDWLKKGILLMWINFLHSLMEPLEQRHILFIVSVAAIRLTVKCYPSPAMCMFLNEIVNRERSESCYITCFIPFHTLLVIWYQMLFIHIH